MAVENRAQLPLRERMARMERTLLAIAVLAFVAAATQWLVWLNERSGEVDTFVGPPRSDYVLSDFELDVLNDQGRLAFTVTAPRLAKHPQLDTLAIDAPRFRLFDGKRNEWLASSRTGWVRADAKELRLTGDVKADRTATRTVGAVAIASEQLTALLEENRITSDTAVTIEQAGSILRGTGLEADLNTDRFLLKQKVSARYESVPKG
ncbi:MAG TPA: LPS export ABC transporter periplasmic protein LptC [Xanthomonadales bacterium]|nr:LPS export ABC transporter periplasmic protein LptC [Xanthomonadales bacterium]